MLQIFVFVSIKVLTKFKPYKCEIAAEIDTGLIRAQKVPQRFVLVVLKKAPNPTRFHHYDASVINVAHRFNHGELHQQWVIEWNMLKV